MAGQIDAHGLCRHLIIPDSLESPAVGGVDQQHDHRHAHPRQQKRYEGGQPQDHLAVGILDIEAGEGGEVLQGVGAVGHRAEGVPLENGPDDLREAQGGNGQIVGLQTQHRQADEPRHRCRHAAAQKQGQQNAQHQPHSPAAEQLRQGEIHGGAVIEIVHRFPVRRGNGENGVGVSAQQHEARLSQRKQAGEAIEQVHGHRHQRVNRALFQDGEQHPRGLHGVFQQDDQRQQRQRAEQGDHRAPFAFLFVQHSRFPLTLCP